MKMQLIDYTLIGILASGMATQAAAEDPVQGAPAAGATQCGESGCKSSEGVLFKLRTRGEQSPVINTTGEHADSTTLRPERHETIEAERIDSKPEHDLKPGKAMAMGLWSVDLPGGGVIWATEDPNLGQPQFNVSAPSLVPFDGSRITKPVLFYAYNNYPAFIQRAEVLVFRSADTDLVSPLAKIDLPVADVSEVQWDGVLSGGYQLQAGDELLYLVRAYGANGTYDETFPRRLQLVHPEEVERGNKILRNSVERSTGTAMNTANAERRRLLQDVFGENGLRQQNIPIYGSRIRIQGRDIPDDMSVRINGHSHPVDLQRELVAEYLVPVGRHQFFIDASPRGQQAVRERLDIDVSGKYIFAVAIADFTASGNSVSGSIEPLAGDDRYNDSLLIDGRLAFYLKGKVKGKYLITAQADTQERELRNLFNGFWDADPQEVFRRLDPDAYYPVYGDDSTTLQDVATMGRLYVRVDWDKNQALWGNFNTGVTGTEYGQYSRSLYGAALNWRSRTTTDLGQPGTQIKAFGSEAQTSPGHSELLGTGGSLYYLKHTDVLPGSDKVVLEVRDNTTGRVERRVELARGADYEIDEFQGRLLLTRPLTQITRENISTLTRDAPLDGFVQVLLVDYEFLPNGFDADDATIGFRGKHWFGNHVAVGATWIDENRAGEDYSLEGLDLTLQAGRGTYLKFEQNRTEATSAPIFFSDDGGLSFTELNPVTGSREGDARAIEARANLQELGWTDLDWSVGAWWRKVDAGFSVGRFDRGQEVREYGAEVLGQFAPNLNVRSRFSRAERGADALVQAQVAGEWRIKDPDVLSAELRRVEEQRLFGDAAGLLAALQYTHRFASSLDVYGTAQFTVDDDDGRYADNDALTLGAKYLFGNLSSIGAEVINGDRGDAAQFNGEYQISPEHSVYGRYTYSTDKTDYDPLFNNNLNSGWTLGQRWRPSNQLNLFNESQFLTAPDASGLAHTFGMDFYPGVGWSLSFTLQNANLDREVGMVNRRAISVSAGRSSNDTQWRSKLEWRNDSGVEQRTQWVTTSNFTHKLNDSWRIAARFNYSKTTDDQLAAAGAKFIEGNFGFAYRPFDSGKWALLGRYTYLYDVSALEQVGNNAANFDQRSKVLSLEGIYKPNVEWEFASKLLRRDGEVRFGRLSGKWADSSATFAAIQGRYAFADNWHMLAEYRWLGATDGGDRQGFLIGIDRNVGKNMRLGVGYNFTEFSDDLTDFDYDHKGWFVNLVGWY